MKSIALNIRALVFDGQTPPPADARIVYNAKSDSHDLVGFAGNSLGKIGLLRMRDLLAHELIGATDHVYVSWAGHSGQAGVTSFAVRSCHVALGRQVHTSPEREVDPSTGTARVGPFALGYTDELVLSSDAKGDQVVTLALLIGTAVEVERLLKRDQDGQVGDAVALHAATHQDGGSDPLNVSGLSGVLADKQNPVAHADLHANGGIDELNVGGLSGVLAEKQNPVVHADLHETGGDDELDVTNLVGELADPQKPKLHASSHHAGEADEIKLDALGEPDDGTLLDANEHRHGLLPRLSDVDTQVLSGIGTWIDVDPINVQSFIIPGTYLAGVDGWVKPDRGRMALIICTGGGGGGG
ncbi:MAG TPA: hypothetical protein VM869_05395, partial [Enhygromyxa sp.]|nr:hypothetical protein [Enhygromyxa sp.]